ncbi:MULTISPECIES: DUF1236 domain-containing protein [unclassified Bradyrhizobium]
MSNRFMISVAALALVAGTGLANAQGTMNRDSGGAGAQPAQQTQPSGGAAEHGTMGKDSVTKEKGTVGQAGGASATKPGAAAEDKSSGAMKDERPGGAMHKNAAEDKAGATKGQRTDERAQGQMDKSQQDKSKSMSQDTTKSGAKDHKDMKAEDNKAGTSTKSNAENRPGSGTSTDMKAEGKSSTSTTVGQAGAGAKLSTEQRTQITSVIREERVAPVTNVNFAISVGTRVPREGIELHALPSRVVTIYPEWRSYRYVLVREQIVIIDPNTYEIVAILDV